MTQAEMTFTEHLIELRNRLTRCAIAVLLGFFVAYNWHLELFDLLARPVLDGLAVNGIFKLQALQITETIVVYMKVSIVAGIMGTSPYIFFQLWSFVGPGLLPEERRWLLPIALFSTVFFFLGVTFAYKVMMPFMTGFLAEMTQEGGRVEMLLTISNAFSFSLMTMLLFGVIFELPLVIFFLSVLGVVNHTKLIKFFRYFVVVAFVVGAILTPPDPISQSLMAVPLIGLYGIGILISWLVGKRKTEGNEGQPVASGRLWATVLVALTFVGVTIWLLVTLLRPDPRPVELVPAQVALISGVAPSHLGDLGKPSLDTVIRAVGANDEQQAALRGLLAESSEAVLLLVGPDGAAALVATGAASEGQAPGPLAGPQAGVAPGDTLVFGDPKLVKAVLDCADDEDLCLGADLVHAGRLEQLSHGGPLWAYAPEAGDPWRALLPAGAEVETAHALTTVVTLTGSNADVRIALTLADAGAARAWRARTLTWRDQRDRDQEQESRSSAQDVELRGLAASVSELAAATRQLAERAPGDTPARAALLGRLDAVAARVDRAARPTVLGSRGGGRSLIDRLPTGAIRSWEVSTDEADAVLSLKVAQSAVPVLLAAIDEAARAPDDGAHEETATDAEGAGGAANAAAHAEAGSSLDARSAAREAADAGTHAQASSSLDSGSAAREAADAGAHAAAGSSLDAGPAARGAADAGRPEDAGRVGDSGRVAGRAPDAAAVDAGAARAGATAAP